IAVEALAAGDEVFDLHSDSYVPVAWIGHRRVDASRHRRPGDVRPVRITRHAFGPHAPARDLLLSPDHAVFIQDVVIPVRYLVNGASIVQTPIDQVTYYHVELARHGVLLAEGLPAESYLDTGNRSSFANGGEPVELHPDFARRRWDEAACAPLVTSGPQLAAAKASLLARAADLGHATTEDPALRLRQAGRTILPAKLNDTTWRFLVPSDSENVQLLSRITIPAQVTASLEDCRQLGVAVTRIVADGHEVALDSYLLAMGWHAPEPGFRWTTGAAQLPRASVLDISIRPMLPYRIAAAA
ncbi:MAG TPA: Hint domain-containing protein, partial [Acetobacteraceae bacterium]